MVRNEVNKRFAKYGENLAQLRHFIAQYAILRNKCQNGLKNADVSKIFGQVWLTSSHNSFYYENIFPTNGQPFP